MGEVYRARDPRLGREVAVKVLPAEVAADSGSPVPLRARGPRRRRPQPPEHPHRPRRGDPRRARPTSSPSFSRARRCGSSSRGARPPSQQILAYMLQAARGLEAAHAKGIVHRDLKPENLFLTTDGRVKVLDFGLAKLVRSEAEITSEVSTAAHSTPPGQVAGTVLYMSPEQARAQAVDVRSDVFSLRGRALRASGGEAPVPEGHGGGDADRDRGGDAAGPGVPGPRDPPGGRRDRPPVPGEGAGGPLRLGPRRRGGARGGPGGALGGGGASGGGGAEPVPGAELVHGEGRGGLLRAGAGGRGALGADSQPEAAGA